MSNWCVQLVSWRGCSPRFPVVPCTFPPEHSLQVGGNHQHFLRIQPWGVFQMASPLLESCQLHFYKNKMAGASLQAGLLGKPCWGSICCSRRIKPTHASGRNSFPTPRHLCSIQPCDMRWLWRAHLSGFGSCHAGAWPRPLPVRCQPVPALRR